MAYPQSAEALTNISNALSTTFAEEIHRQWNREAVFASMVKMVPAFGQGAGKQIGWEVEFSGASAASFAEGSDVASTEYAVDPVQPATLSFGQYRAAFQLSNLEIKAAAASPAQAAALGRIVIERLKGSLAKMASVMNTDLFNGTGTDGSGNPTIIGFDTAVAASGTYAGISKATYSEWAGNVLANGGTARALTQDLLYNLEQLIYTASGKTPSFIVCTPGVYRKYAGLFEPLRRVESDGRGPLQYNSGAAELFWKGIPVIRDRVAPAGTLRMVSAEDFVLRPLTIESNEDGVAQRAAGLSSTNGEQEKPLGMAVDVIPLARTGSAQKFLVECYLQAAMLRPNAHGLLSDISEV